MHLEDLLTKFRGVEPVYPEIQPVNIISEEFQLNPFRISDLQNQRIQGVIALFNGEDESESRNWRVLTTRSKTSKSKSNNKISSQDAIKNGVYAMRYLIHNLGLSDYQAAGLVGNFMAESSMNPQAFNKQERNGTFEGSNANGTGYGAGLAQWSNQRKANLQNLVGLTTDIETWDLDTLLHAVTQEIMNGEKKGFNNLLRNAKDLNEAVDISLRGYENGGAGTLATQQQIDKYTWAGGYSGLMNTRTSYAQQLLDEYNKSKK